MGTLQRSQLRDESTRAFYSRCPASGGSPRLWESSRISLRHSTPPIHLFRVTSSWRAPKLVPLVPMAPVRTRFMHVPCSLNVLNPAWLAQLGVDPEHHATERMTREQLEALPPNIRRVLSVKTDGVAVDLTVQVGALPYVSRRASGNPTMKRKARERLGVDDADARPAPDPDTNLMGFDPGARALGGFFIRHPDGTTSSGVVPKCGYTKTPSFAFDMTPASFKSTNLDSLDIYLQNSVRFVLLHEQEIRRWDGQELPQSAPDEPHLASKALPQSCGADCSHPRMDSSATPSQYCPSPGSPHQAGCLLRKR
ncbi:Chromosome partition protein Smc [Carpediemonas membranifera]|uniref:Chromosome partition protein Smc n=1 Tax=Carpediemonas membranifera TaxID=201153 RepID=A0A8J6BHI0_9EUKA|nr:Chromosome partition protein Smc [Carpediemonas membranifera]|eukprot:KAG9397587.1 Chromosome partition protein Smc [Carpediemonas membranifera]